jgi:phosphoinositide-3-kinase regulatory subunit 4
LLIVESSLVVITSTNLIAILDIRNMQLSSRFQHPLEFGPITSVCPSTHWLILGTSTGTLSLWDLRFGLLLKSWRAAGSVTSCQIHPSRGKGRWIMVSTVRNSDDRGLVSVYDIESAKLVEIYEVRETRPSSKAQSIPVDVEEVQPDKAGIIEELAAREATPSSLSPDTRPCPSVLALMVGQPFASMPREEDTGSMLMSVPDVKSQSGNPGWMIIAGEDKVIRYWDLTKPSEGIVICGSPKEKEVVFK